jgi:hypothetical protein
LNAVGDSLSDLSSSEDEVNEEDEDDDEEDTELGNLSQDDKHGWVMDTMSKMVQNRRRAFGRGR